MSKKNKPKRKITLTEAFESTDNFRALYLNASANERALMNAKSRKLKYPSNYYAQAFVNNYEFYYKNGGKQVNEFSDYIYKKLTGKELEKPKSNKKSKKNYKKR